MGTFSLGNIKPEFIAGTELFKDDFKGSTFANLYESNNGKGSLQGERLSGTEQKRYFVNAFAQLRVPILKKLEVQAGLNYNKTSFQLDNIFPAESISSQDYSYNAIWSPQLSLLYKPAALQTLYVSASHGFSLPGIEETLTPEGTINPNIKPENGYNLEAGAKFYLFNKKFYTEIALYTMQVKDLLVAQRTGDDQYVGINAGKTLHQGIEFSANYFWQLNQSLLLRPYFAASVGSYKFKEFIDGDNDYTGNDLTGVPANKLNGGFTFETASGLYFSSDFYFTDKIPLNDANSEYNKSYSLLNLKAGYRFTLFEGLAAYIAAGANNITNTQYASMVLVNATGFGGAAPRYYYPGLPANYYGNLMLTYLF